MFGYLCHASSLQSHRTKLQPRARKTVFLGYKSGYKGFILLDIHSREIFVSRQFVFHEYFLPYPSNNESITSQWEYFSPFLTVTSESVATPPSIPIIDDEDYSSSSSHIHSPDIQNSPPPSHIHPSPDIPQSPRKSTRNKTAPAYLQDYVCNHLHVSPYPISNYVSHHNLSNTHSHFVMSLHSHNKPKTYAEASKFDC